MLLQRFSLVRGASDINLSRQRPVMRFQDPHPRTIFYSVEIPFPAYRASVKPHFSFRIEPTNLSWGKRTGTRYRLHDRLDNEEPSDLRCQDTGASLSELHLRGERSIRTKADQHVLVTRSSSPAPGCSATWIPSGPRGVGIHWNASRASSYALAFCVVLLLCVPIFFGLHFLRHKDPASRPTALGEIGGTMLIAPGNSERIGIVPQSSPNHESYLRLAWGWNWLAI